jgi:hypothetical protein
MEYRLYESSGFVADCPAYAESDDFDALRWWAVENNPWKGVRQGAVIGSASGRFWYVSRDGSVREVSDDPGQTGGRSQVAKFADRIDGRRPFTPKSSGDLGYDYPPSDRWQHKTIEVSPRSGGDPPRLQWYDLATGARARKGITEAVYADIKDGTGRYERRGSGSHFTAVFINSYGVESILPMEGSSELAQGVSSHAAYRAHVSHYYGPGSAARRGAAIHSSGVADVEDAMEILARPRGFGPRLSAADRRAIEQHAVSVAVAHFESKGYSVEDVGDYESYDLHATRASEVLMVEVKGTTTDGSAVVLTRNEVELHKTAYPSNALAIVRRIHLTRAEGKDAVPTGGELILRMPWELDDDQLTPIAFSYSTGLSPN